MRLTSKSAGAVFCTALLLLLILFEIRAHNRLHSDDIVGGGGDGGGGGWSGLGFAELAAIHDPVEARLAALEAKIDEIAARQAAQVDELGAKLTASLTHLDGQLGRLDARTGDGGQPGAGAGASTGAPHKDGEIDTRDDVGKRPLPIECEPCGLAARKPPAQLLPLTHPPVNPTTTSRTVSHDEAPPSQTPPTA